MNECRKKMNIVKDLEKISKKVCKELPEKNYKASIMYTDWNITWGATPMGIGIYTENGFLFKELDETYALIPLKDRTVLEELGSERYLKENGLNIRSSDEKILKFFKEKIDESKLKRYLDENDIELKFYLDSELSW